MENKISMKKNVLIAITIIMLGLCIAGGTYAYLTYSVNATNGNYNMAVSCFTIDYNINNTDGTTQDITGTLFPSGTITSGLNGRVGMKINSGCEINGLGTITLHIDSGTSSTLTTSASSYCVDRSTLEQISGISTEAACHAANVNGIWRGYADSYCENPLTLERMTDYTTQSDCTNNGGTWTSGGSPLKYAVYDNESAIGTPVSVGKITSSDIGNDVTIYDDFVVGHNQKYYYIYIWLDGYLTDDEYVDLPFSAYVTASANQDNDLSLYEFVDYIQNSGTQYIDTGYVPNYNNDIHIEIISKPTAASTRYCLLSNYATSKNLSLELSTAAGRIYYNNGNVDSLSGTVSISSKNIYIFDYFTAATKYKLVFNDDSITGSMTATGTSGNNMLLFVDQQKRFSTFNTPIKIYNLIISENSVLLRNMIPCYRKSDSAVGMYDTVNGVFYSNANTSSATDFTYG